MHWHVVLFGLGDQSVLSWSEHWPIVVRCIPATAYYVMAVFMRGPWFFMVSRSDEDRWCGFDAVVRFRHKR